MEKVKALDIFATRYTMELGLKTHLRILGIDYHVSPSRETWPWGKYIIEAGDRAWLLWNCLELNATQMTMSTISDQLSFFFDISAYSSILERGLQWYPKHFQTIAMIESEFSLPSSTHSGQTYSFARRAGS